ncbi:hypothetical protein ES288_A06G065100v1 [Gossypium darwinii]|uniref:Plant heme peroxidase family profile domain-containing protein n=1 Tax=Gossypium darwinii TaxID=34276 RepID=A0A5D2G2J6_GOSDA|nr:hypothetical protein ES288_A06G065100v1 [Gossypium darwinii]
MCCVKVLCRDLNNGRGRVFGRVTFIAVADITDAIAVIAGGHTIGISHCPAVSRRLYNSTGPRRIDPTMDSKHTENLKILATTHSCSKEGVGCEPKLILFSIVPERNPQPSSHPSI